MKSLLVGAGRRAPQQVTLLDDDVFEWASAHRWMPTYMRSGKVYVMRHDGRQTLYLHREIMGLQRGDGLEVDHVDGDCLNNQRGNLRVVTHAQNQQNRAGVQAHTSRFRGVFWTHKRKRWLAVICLNGRRIRQRHFIDEEEAGRVVAAWRAELMPFSAEAG